MFGIKKKANNKKVLIVEDDALLSQVLFTAFLKEKFQVMLVENGLEVGKAVRTFAPDIILLDLIIPGVDGFAVLKQLKSEEKTKGIPVVVVSNLDTAGDVKSIKTLGAEEYFIKANTEMASIVKFVKDKLKV